MSEKVKETDFPFFDKDNRSVVCGFQLQTKLKKIFLNQKNICDVWDSVAVGIVGKLKLLVFPTIAYLLVFGSE